ncbi:MAG: OmpP1/FadL family transporter [Flavobacterium sp.]
MKRYLFFASALLGAATMQAQEMVTAGDAVRYGVDNVTGTARFRAMSGAFGALGGDISAMGVNPAGMAIFNYNTGTVSGTSYNMSNNASYLGTSRKKNDNAFEINQIGGIFVFNSNNPDAVMKKFTLGFNYENTGNLDNSFFVQGTNPNNSFSDYFLSYANGVQLGVLQDAWFEDMNFAEQQAYLGYNAYLIDPLTDASTNTSYQAAENIANSSNYYQEAAVSSSGFNGKVNLNFATQLQNWLYLGLNLNVHFTDYIKNTSVYEDYNAPANTGLQSFRFDTQRYTYGGGFSMNVGAIAKVTEQFRVGVAYESPTWYSLQDEVRQSISSFCPECNGGTGSYFTTDPGYTFILPDYSLRTPGKWTGSLAYIFGKSGLISVDGAIKDYSNTRYTSDNFSTINAQLSDNLGYAAELRVGAEYRIKAFSLRGGFRYEQSPYEENVAMGDLRGYSGGLGYTFGNSRIDLAYSYYSRWVTNSLFDGNGFANIARVNTDNNNVTLSYTIDL